MYWRPLRVEVDPKNLLVSLKDLMRLYVLLSSHNILIVRISTLNFIALSLIPLFVLTYFRRTDKVRV